jgi:formylmethanofuran dehydrogenase subunit E
MTDDPFFNRLPEDLKSCVTFHGHLCPGLVYGYLVAKEAAKRLHLSRSGDEEVVAITENDSCAVDALQVILGTTAGKGNLIFKNYGKNAYTIIDRTNQRSLRFSRNDYYRYSGEQAEEFDRLDKKITAKTATPDEIQYHKKLKAADLLSRPFDEVFTTKPATEKIPPYAPLARSVACNHCGEMTMASKTVETENGGLVCLPCANRIKISCS